MIQDIAARICNICHYNYLIANTPSWGVACQSLLDLYDTRPTRGSKYKAVLDKWIEEVEELLSRLEEFYNNGIRHRFWDIVDSFLTEGHLYNTPC